MWRYRVLINGGLFDHTDDADEAMRWADEARLNCPGAKVEILDAFAALRESTRCQPATGATPR